MPRGSTLRLSCLTLVLALLAAGAAEAQTRRGQRAPAAPPPAAQQDARYKGCIARAEKEPGAAFQDAVAWIRTGGGDAARHCSAVALIGLGAPGEAAEQLEQLAEETASASPRLRADILGQAGQAWLLADEPHRARMALTDALRLAPDDPDLLIDRAQTFAAIGEYWLAIDDLNRAVERAPRRTEALVLRASAYREVGSPELALDDADRALAIDPNLAEAHLQRGIVFRVQGRKPQARQALLRVLLISPESPEGDAAREQIERLELGTPEPPAAPAGQQRRRTQSQ